MHRVKLEPKCMDKLKHGLALGNESHVSYGYPILSMVVQTLGFLCPKIYNYLGKYAKFLIVPI